MHNTLQVSTNTTYVLGDPKKHIWGRCAPRSPADGQHPPARAQHHAATVPSFYITAGTRPTEAEAGRLSCSSCFFDAGCVEGAKGAEPSMVPRPLAGVPACLLVGKARFGICPHPNTWQEYCHCSYRLIPSLWATSLSLRGFTCWHQDVFFTIRRCCL